jgi:rubrerythrin
MVTSHEFFKLAELIETLARDIYLRLAEHRSTPAGLSQLFTQLADEEEHHGQRIRLMATSLRGSSSVFQLVKAATAGLQSVATELQAFLLEVTTRRQPGDLPRLLERLVEMEERFSFVHAEELTKVAAPDAARLFASLAKQDVRHRRLLEKVRPQAGGAAPAA